MMEWITDRRPTTEDENGNGEVLMRRFPDGRKSIAGVRDALVAAAHVGPGVPWMHTGDWKPPATPEPEPEAPQPAPKPELRVGQVWRTRNGDEVVITVNDNSAVYPFKGSNDESYTPDGRWVAGGGPWSRDLVDLITDAPAAPTPEPEPEPTPATELDLTQLDPIQPEPWPLPRVFAAPIRRTFLPSGGQVLDAIADDGTCWEMYPDGSWEQIPPLPDREEVIDA